MLPKQFFAYGGNAKKNYFMFNYIDLLIADEAGQISPEIGLPVFSLAKKAVVVGDEKQIPPIWGNDKAIDMAMAITNNVIKDKNEFYQLEENGLNCSSSSLMKIAALSCPFEKYGKGLFLSEHRRCYDEIVSYCNQLVYDGKLEPMRGTIKKDKKYILKDYLPPMGHYQIETQYSHKSAGSRVNKTEANEILLWISNHYEELCKRYKFAADEKGENFKESSIVGIITPFKGQSNYLNKCIRRYYPHIAKNISIGTVHTFQGAERKIIIFSSVYGKNDGCSFIDQNKSLMNVAVSRAQDSFLVFGDRDCLIGGKDFASYILKEETSMEIGKKEDETMQISKQHVV